MVEQDEKDKCLEYIERLTDTYTASRMMVQTGNVVLDSIISLK